MVLMARRHRPPEGRKGSAMAYWRTLYAAIAVAIVILPNAIACSSATSADPATIRLTNLNVAVVPAVDSAGFFIALYDGLFRAQGLAVHFIPAVSSETEINSQAQELPAGNPVDISCGAYPSYITAQRNWDDGQRASPAHPDVVAADLEIFAEGSIMTPGAQGLYVMPDSPVRTIKDLEGKTIGINAPGNILYLLVAATLADAGIPVSDVRFRYIPLPLMAQALKTGQVAAATLPEPFASQADLSIGVIQLTDMDTGAMTSFPVQGCAVTREWAQANPLTLAAFTRAYEQGQQMADASRSAVERAMEMLPSPLGVTREVAALMAVDSYPFGPVDVVRIQRVADDMQEFLGGPRFNVAEMVGP
jgi:NitT/TauT family transport system substrate-binding protein